MPRLQEPGDTEVGTIQENAIAYRTALREIRVLYVATSPLPIAVIMMRIACLRGLLVWSTIVAVAGVGSA